MLASHSFGLSCLDCARVGRQAPTTHPDDGYSVSVVLHPDGKRLAYMELDPGTAYHLSTVPLESDSARLRAGRPEVFLQTSSDERYPCFSPDGRWLAYVSNESGSFQVYV